MEHSFRLLIRSSTPGLKARSFDSNDTDCYHFVHREHVETSSYVCFSSQADSLARCCYGTLDAVRNEAGVQTLAISETLFIQAVQIILQAHICIKIWTKYHDDTGQYNWELENAITPGDTAGIGVPGPPSIAVIDVTPLNNSTMLGLCFSSFPISVYEFEDTNIPSLLERLHSLLQQLRPRECIIFNRRPTRESEADIYDDFFWIPHLKNILRELDIFCSCVDTSRVSKTRLYVPETDDSIIMSILSHMVCVEHDSAFLQAGDDIKTNLARRPSGCAALIRLLQRLRLFAPESVPSTHASIKITFPPETGVLLCDRSTYAALRVFGCQHKKTAASIADDPFTFGVPQSLFSILNVCRTNRGSELLRRWLQQPSTDRFTLARRHAVVREFCARPLLRDAVQRCLAGLPDIEVIAWRLQTPLGSRLSPQNYLTDMVSTLRYISRAFDAVKIVRGDVSMLCSDCNGMLTEIEKCLEDCLPLQTLLMTYIETESDANVDLWQVGVCENSAVAGESSESENCIGSPSTPLYSATDSICAPTDVYDRYTKHSICRVKPALSPELMALDAAYQNSIYQLIEEKNRMSSFMEGLTKPHDVSFGPSMCNQQDDESSPAIKRKRSNYFYINSTFLLSKKGDRRDLVHIEHNYNLGYHLRIARRGRHVLYSALEDERVRAAGIDINVISGANKKGVLFTSKQFSALSNKCKLIQERYLEAEKEITIHLIQQLKPFLNSIRQLSLFISRFDCLLSFSEVSNQLNWTMPIMLPMRSKGMVLLQLRDPVVQARVGVAEYVASDYDMNAACSSKEFIDGAFILTGPNMGGKTTFLNAVGNAVILAHIGCFLPASYAAIPIFDRILTHRSSGDSILNGTSCFMSDMLDVVRVLKTATSNSLVLMDELGVGTSTNTGIGIAIAVISRLVAEIECTVLCSTHFREIGIRIVREVEKMLKSSPGSLDADQFTRSRNFHVDVEESKSKVEGERSTKLLYRVVPGPLEQTGSSFAIEVAKSYSGLPAELIDDANAILAREEMILCPSR